MKEQTFSELNFLVHKEIFYEVLENQDKGFGFKAVIKTNLLSEMQIDTLDFLIQCKKKEQLGVVSLTFTKDAIGEIKPQIRTVEDIKKTKDSYIISNSY